MQTERAPLMRAGDLLVGVNRGLAFGLFLGLAGVLVIVLGWVPLELELRHETSGGNAVGQGILAWLATGLGAGMVLLSLFTIGVATRQMQPVATRGFDPSKLDAVYPGMSQAQVERELGAPIETWHHQAPGVGDLLYLAYSKRTQSDLTFYDVVVLSPQRAVIRTERNYNA